MSYKTVLVHVDDSQQAPQRILIAQDIAQRFDAHLIGVALTGISRYIFESSNLGAGDPNISLHLGVLRERAERALVQFGQLTADRASSTTESLIANDEANGGLGLRARYCDLIVIGQTNPAEPSPTVMSDFPEFMIVHSGRPILVIPHHSKIEKIGERCLIAWNGSREASRAVTDAIPLLKLCKQVMVAIINPKPYQETHGEEPGADIALFLARHGIQVEVVTRFSKHPVGDTLLSLGAEYQCDLMVMGGYGHSRFREMLMGGSTRTILEKATIPVLMSH